MVLRSSFRGDVSRLVDVARQSIIFEHLSDLVTCLDVGTPSCLADTQTVHPSARTKFSMVL